MAAAALVLGWALLGWLVGAAAAPWVQRLIGPDAPDLGPPPRLVALGPLAPDLVLQGLLAVALALLAWREGPGLTLVVHSAYAAVLAVVLLIDFRTRYVYHVIVFPALAAALVLTPLASGQPFWSGAAGALVGALALLALRLIGALVYRGQEAVASGDVTIGALVGATTGLQVVVPALLGGIILGGVLALVTAATRRSLSGTMAYGPGLCLGAFLALLAPR